jgi:tetratricopeptide (TPR) repeat protein
MVRVILMVVLLGLPSYAQTSDPTALGNQHFLEGKYKDAASAYEQVAATQRTAETLNRLGASYHLLNRLREAEATYKLALKANPNFGPAHNNLGALYYSQRKFGDADGEFREAAEHDPQNAVIRRNLRASRYARENGRPARTRADEVAKERPLLVDERYGDMLGVFLLVPPKDLEAASTFEKRGDSFLVRKMFDDAIIEYKKSIAIDKYNAVVVNRLGLTYHQNQKYEDAERQYREALKLNSYYLDALNNLGTIFYSRRRFSDALDSYRKALKIWPDSPTVWQNLGAVLFDLKRYSEAGQAYERALQLDPKLFERQASGAAGTQIQMSQKKDMMASFVMATVFASKGDKDRAISSLYSAYESGFTDVEKVKAEPAFASLKTDERFIRLIEAMSVPGGPRT